MGPVVEKKKKEKFAQLCLSCLKYATVVIGRTLRRFCKGFIHLCASVCVRVVSVDACLCVCMCL